MTHPIIQNVIDHPAHATVGAVIGTFLIPIPIVGTLIGAGIGGWWGKKKS